jgi:hypothetical protein
MAVPNHRNPADDRRATASPGLRQSYWTPQSNNSVLIRPRFLSLISVSRYESPSIARATTDELCQIIAVTTKFTHLLGAIVDIMRISDGFNVSLVHSSDTPKAPVSCYLYEMKFSFFESATNASPDHSIPKEDGNVRLGSQSTILSLSPPTETATRRRPADAPAGFVRVAPALSAALVTWWLGTLGFPSPGRPAMSKRMP